MTRYRNVDGNINESTGGSHKIFSKKNIIVAQTTGTSIIRAGTGGANFYEPQTPPKPTKEYRLDVDLAWLSMVIMYDDTDYSVGKSFNRTEDDCYKFKLVHIEKDEMLGFKFYIFGFIMYDKSFYTGVFMGTRTNNWGSFMDNLTMGVRVSRQVDWAHKLGIFCRVNYPNIIFTGHSKGGREAAFAAISHGYAPVYSYNTSIAYLDDTNAVDLYVRRGGEMYHYTVVGELLIMKGWNGHNAGFKPILLYPDSVNWRSWNNQVFIEKVPTGKYKIEWYWSFEPGYRNTPNGEKVSFGDQVSRHTDFPLLWHGLLKKGGNARPGTRMLIYNTGRFN